MMPFLSHRAIKAAGQSEITQKENTKTKMQRKTNMYHGLGVRCSVQMCYTNTNRTSNNLVSSKCTTNYAYAFDGVWYLHTKCIHCVCWNCFFRCRAFDCVCPVCSELALD